MIDCLWNGSTSVHHVHTPRYNVERKAHILVGRNGDLELYIYRKLVSIQPFHCVAVAFGSVFNIVFSAVSYRTKIPLSSTTGSISRKRSIAWTFPSWHPISRMDWTEVLLAKVPDDCPLVSRIEECWINMIKGIWLTFLDSREFMLSEHLVNGCLSIGHLHMINDLSPTTCSTFSVDANAPTSFQNTTPTLQKKSWFLCYLLLFLSLLADFRLFDIIVWFTEWVGGWPNRHPVYNSSSPLHQFHSPVSARV